MPFKFDIDPQRNFVHETWWGPITVNDLRQISLDEWADSRYRKGMDVISDFSQAQVEISYEEMTGYVNFIAAHDSVGKQAIVVGRQLEFGLARMFELLTEDSHELWESLRIFYSLDEARAWIEGTTPDERAPHLTSSGEST